jgi:hypothetical protein
MPCLFFFEQASGKQTDGILRAANLMPIHSFRKAKWFKWVSVPSDASISTILSYMLSKIQTESKCNVYMPLRVAKFEQVLFPFEH